MSYRCPDCHESDTLWEEVNVPGWRSVDADLKVTGRSVGDRDVEWDDVESWGQYGCSCGWGPANKTALEELGIDDEPLPSVHRDQLTLTTDGSPACRADA